MAKTHTQLNILNKPIFSVTSKHRKTASQTMYDSRRTMSKSPEPEVS